MVAICSLHLHSFTSPFFYSFYSEKAKYYHIHVLTDILFKIHDSKKAKNALSIEPSTEFLLRERIKESRHLKNKSIGTSESYLTLLINEEFYIQVRAANLHLPKMDYPLLLILHHSNESHQ